MHIEQSKSCMCAPINQQNKLYIVILFYFFFIILLKIETKINGCLEIDTGPDTDQHNPWLYFTLCLYAISYPITFQLYLYLQLHSNTQIKNLSNSQRRIFQSDKNRRFMSFCAHQRREVTVMGTLIVKMQICQVREEMRDECIL